MGKGLPQQVVSIWNFSTSVITYLLSIPIYDRIQSFTWSFLFVIMLFIFSHSGHNEEQLTQTGGLKLFNFFLTPLMNSLNWNDQKWYIASKPGVWNAVNGISNIPFYIEEYMAISSLTRQWRHQKLEVDLSREGKMILQCAFVVVIILDVWNHIFFLIFCASLPLKTTSTIPVSFKCEYDYTRIFVRKFLDMSLQFIWVF